MQINVYALSDRGIVRPKNQDNLICAETKVDIGESGWKHCGTYSTNTPSLFGVFDGMGGHLCGERASEIAADTASYEFAAYRGGAPDRLVQDICFKSNEIICDEMQRIVKGRMGTTASMLLFENDRFQLCNLGDSPIFLIRNGSIEQISYEHSERHNYERVFGTNYDKKKKFRLTQNLGIFPDEMELSPYLLHGEINEGDVFLICSDGLTDMVETDEILSVISKSNSVEDAGETLLSLALANGGRDNITIILGKVVNNAQGYVSKAAGSKGQSKGMLALIIAGIAAVLLAAAVGAFFLFNPLGDNTDKEPSSTQPASVNTTVKPAEKPTESKSTYDEPYSEPGNIFNETEPTDSDDDREQKVFGVFELGGNSDDTDGDDFPEAETGGLY